MDSKLADFVGEVYEDVNGEDEIPAGKQRVSCNQCEMLSINGRPSHETGCPNENSRWDREAQDWVKQRECFECGATVDYDDPCCSAPAEEEEVVFDNYEPEEEQDPSFVISSKTADIADNEYDIDAAAQPGDKELGKSPTVDCHEDHDSKGQVYSSKQALAKGYQGLANKIKLIDDKIWEKLGIDNGGQLMPEHGGDPQLYERYKQEVLSALAKAKITQVPTQVIHELENENFHRINKVIMDSGLGKYASSKQADTADNPANEAGGEGAINVKTNKDISNTRGKELPKENAIGGRSAAKKVADTADNPANEKGGDGAILPKTDAEITNTHGTSPKYDVTGSKKKADTADNPYNMENDGAGAPENKKVVQKKDTSGPTPDNTKQANQNTGITQMVGEKHDHGIEGDVSQAKSECASPDTIDQDISQPTVSVQDAGKRKNAAEPVSGEDKGFYVTVSYVKGGIKLKATPEIANIAENTNHERPDMHDLMEDFLQNGWEEVHPEDIGALTSGEIVSDSNGNIYWHERYQIEDMVEELQQGNEVFMQYGGNLFEGGTEEQETDIKSSAEEDNCPGCGEPLNNAEGPYCNGSYCPQETDPGDLPHKEGREKIALHFMNQYDIDEAVQLLDNDPVLGKAARFLRDFRDQVNGHSDGWAYWRAPVAAANQLMTLIEAGMAKKRGRYDQPEIEITDRAIAKAMGPIKSFMTRRGLAAGMEMPKLAAFVLTAAFVRTAAIRVSQGQDEQGFHMLLDMNGREYVLRGNDADAFRKEYAAIPKPEAQVNQLVEKYMNKLQPYRKQTVPVAPGVSEKAQARDRAEGLADADAYHGGKEKQPNDYRRYMTQHASDISGDMSEAKSELDYNKGEMADDSEATDTVNPEHFAVEKVRLKCNECGRKFSVSPNASDPECPKCHGVDWDVESGDIGATSSKFYGGKEAANKLAEMDLRKAIAVFTKQVLGRLTNGEDVTEELEALNHLRAQAGLQPIVIPKDEPSGHAPEPERPRSQQRRTPSRSQAPREQTGMAVHVPEDAQLLPDNSQWTNRFKIKSESSARLYTIAQNKNRRYWGCDCPGWISHRNCKHLRALGLPSHEKPYEATLKQGSLKAAEFAEKLAAAGDEFPEEVEFDFGAGDLADIVMTEDADAQS